MTDKLQDVVEQFIADNWWCIVHEDQQCDCSSGFVSTDYLRAFLAQYVLCNREPVGTVAPSKNGAAISMTVAAIKVPASKETPLHTPATEPKP